MKIGFTLRRTQKVALDFARHIRESYYYLREYFYENSFKKPDSSRIKRVLVIQEGVVGDTYNVVGFLNQLAESYPCIGIYCLTRDKEKGFYKNPKLNVISKEVAESMIKGKQFDALLSYGSISHFFNKKLVFNIPYRVGRIFPYKTRTVPDELIIMFKKLGFNITSQKFYFTSQGEETAKKLYEYLDKPIIILHVGSGKTVRAIREGKIPSSYWPSKSWALLADYLVERYNCNLLFTGVKEEKFLVEEIIKMVKKKENIINASGKYSIEEIASIAKRAKLVIAIDSGMAHVLSQVGIPVIILFAGNPIISAPLKNSINIWNSKVCNGCRKYYCVEKNPVCINSISIEEVLRNIPKDLNS